MEPTEPEFDTPAFDEWVRAWFDRPDPWDWINADDLPNLSPEDTLAYATRLFTHSGELLAPYSDNQVGKGFWALINEMESPLYVLQDQTQPVDTRRACIASIDHVYTDVFTHRCTEALGYCSEKSSQLNTTCYMWWDIFPLYGNACPELDETVLNVMKNALALPHAACQESALHGLGHWNYRLRDQTKNPAIAIIDAFLVTNTARRPEVTEYAHWAHTGMIL